MVLDVVDTVVESVDVDLGSHLFEPHPAQLSPERHRTAGGDHRLGGNAVEKVGGTADDVAFDDRDFGTEASGVRCSGVAGRTSADDEEAHSHGDRLPVVEPRLQDDPCDMADATTT